MPTSRLLAATLLAAFFAAAPAWAATDKLAGADKRFLEKAAAHSQAEIELGRLAGEKALRDEVRTFGELMVRDHGKATEELQALASARGLQLPAPDDRHRKDLEKLRKLQGPDFDRAYMKRMVDEHEKDVQDFRERAKSSKDDEVRAFAQRQLPILQAHLQSARATSDASQGSKRTGDRETGSSKP